MNPQFGSELNQPRREYNGVRDGVIVTNQIHCGAGVFSLSSVSTGGYVLTEKRVSSLVFFLDENAVSVSESCDVTVVNACPERIDDDDCSAVIVAIDEKISESYKFEDVL
ncbi:hypothetical protein F2Q70_00032827 [Brassica cretica]|uniref:Uncharacterized protein n=1 Tax=Brassica cretica TaxID=69181 RepID=A0A8S9FSP7_BRACR|nr:hypothetical protein F2Q70_00032827 [Brassica cretica]